MTRATLTLLTWSAGASPNSSADATAAMTEKPKTRTSGANGAMCRAMSANPAGMVVMSRVTAGQVTTQAMPNPAMAAGNASRRLSVRNCWTSRDRAAQVTGESRSRADARALA